MSGIISSCPTQHAEVQFGSGDYYIFCHACHRKWAMMGWDQPEYGEDAAGRKIGADPLVANRSGVFANDVRVKA